MFVTRGRKSWKFNENINLLAKIQPFIKNVTLELKSDFFEKNDIARRRRSKYYKHSGILRLLGAVSRKSQIYQNHALFHKKSLF